jgi:hypothetical protein
MKECNQRSIFLCLIFACIGALFAGCGGGSSGTGNVNGIIIDEKCNPVENLPLDSLGIESAQATTSADGSFEFKPDREGSVRLPSSAQSNSETKISESACVVIQYEAGQITEINIIPEYIVDDCSYESLVLGNPSIIGSICK